MSETLESVNNQNAAIEKICVAMDQVGWALYHADESFTSGAEALGREHALAALAELRLVAKSYLETSEFQAARAWDNSAEPVGEEPRHSDELAAEIRSCLDALRKCRAIPSSARESLGKAMAQFADNPRAAIRFAAGIAGVREFIRSKGAR